MNKLMKSFKWLVLFLLGLPMTFCGTVLLACSFPLGWNHNNWVLLTCLLLIFGGIVLHVALAKHRSRY